MPSGGIYASPVLIERTGTYSAAALGAQYLVATDLEVEGLMANVATAPGTGHAITVNVAVTPQSQLTQSAAGSPTSQQTPNPYNLWTATNVPTISGAANNSFSISQSNVFYGAQDLVTNSSTTTGGLPVSGGYALNYPFPGPASTVGYETAQQTSTITSAPVTSPPVVYKTGIGALVQPDNTYTSFNGDTASASILHAGDLLTFNMAAGTGGAGSAAGNIVVVLFCQKR